MKLEPPEEPRVLRIEPERAVREARHIAQAIGDQKRAIVLENELWDVGDLTRRPDRIFAVDDQAVDPVFARHATRSRLSRAR
jgi:hypothetical protein